MKIKNAKIHKTEIYTGIVKKKSNKGDETLSLLHLS